MLDRWISRHWILFSILILTLSGGWIWASKPAAVATSPKTSAPQQGFLAPDFTLDTFSGEQVSLADLRGKVVLINFWASWCLPCRAEMKAIQNVYAEYQNQGFVVLAINATYQDEVANATQFAQAEGLTFPLLSDQDGSVDRSYRVLAMPTSFFVDRQGKIVKVVIGGPMAEALIQTQIESMLGGN
jgi:cytochrome c biogenesis protein CcmG/thiol:disulfide interchange protein DsbE